METVLLISIFAGFAILSFLTMKLLTSAARSTVEPTAFWFKSPALGALTKPLAKILGTSKMKNDDLKSELISAGYYHSSALENYLAIRNCAMMLAALLVAFLFVTDAFLDQEWVGLIAGIAVVGTIYSIPRLVLINQGKKRVGRIEKAIPDALDMIVMAMASGLPLNRALDRVASELKSTYQELAKELQIVANQSNTCSLEKALADFAKRIKLPEIVSLSTLIGQSQKLGGKLVDSLNDYAKRIRVERQRRAEHAGNTASIKLLLPVVTCLAPPIFILLVGPAILDFRNFINRERENHGQVIQQINSPGFTANRQSRISSTSNDVPENY